MASPGDRPPPADGGIDFTTLLLSAIASAAAAYITSKVWGPGTLFSAAMAPVIVALVKEGLRKPTEKVASVATVPRWSRTGTDEPGLVAQPDPTPSPDVHLDPDAPHGLLPPVVPAQPAPVRVYSTRARRLRWRLAVITGLLGFGVAVVAFTIPELLAGESLGGAHKTTIFGGHHKSTKKSGTTTSTTSTTQTATTPAQTQTTETVTRTETVTTPAPATPTTTTPTTTTQSPAPAGPSSSAPPTTQAP